MDGSSLSTTALFSCVHSSMLMDEFSIPLSNRALRASSASFRFLNKPPIKFFILTSNSEFLLVRYDFFGMLRQFHQVTFLEENILQNFSPCSVSPQQEFEIHAEVDKFLLLRMCHHFFGLVIGFDRNALLVPVDGIRFLDHRHNQLGKRASL